MTDKKKLLELLTREIEAALGPDYKERFEFGRFFVKEIAHHLIECGWTKHVA